LENNPWYYTVHSGQVWAHGEAWRPILCTCFVRGNSCVRVPPEICHPDQLDWRATNWSSAHFGRAPKLESFNLLGQTHWHNFPIWHGRSPRTEPKFLHGDSRCIHWQGSFALNSHMRKMCFLLNCHTLKVVFWNSSTHLMSGFV